MVRNSLKFVPWKDYKAVTAALKKVYQLKTEDEALLELQRLVKCGITSTHKSASLGMPISTTSTPYLITLTIYAR
jgi:transposase-like protein